MPILEVKHCLKVNAIRNESKIRNITNSIFIKHFISYYTEQKFSIFNSLVRQTEKCNYSTQNI
ncbi:hypothetical protein T06_6935 [Trichinella sp. T6]|nr:hypothetical protein T06_6935 [Trichinella sp. T6]